MCKVIAVINKGKNNKSLINKILQANLKKLAAEDDGYSVYKEGETKFFAGFSAYQLENMRKNLKYNNEEFFITHFRTATAGNKGVGGLHLQKIKKRYVYAHNGWVKEFSTVTDYSDSHYFFEALLGEKNEIVSKIGIEELAEAAGFTGKGFLYDEKEKELHFFNNQRAYLYVFEDCLIISTFDLNLDYKKIIVHDCLGYQWETEGEEETITPLHTANIDDRYMIFKESELLLDFEFKVSTTYYPYNNHSNHTPKGTWKKNKKGEWKWLQPVQQN